MNNRLETSLDIITKSDNKVVAVVMHGGALRALMPILKDLPKDNSFQYDFDNASITYFEYSNGKFKSILENSTEHLRN